MGSSWSTEMESALCRRRGPGEGRLARQRACRKDGLVDGRSPVDVSIRAQRKSSAEAGIAVRRKVVVTLLHHNGGGLGNRAATTAALVGVGYVAGVSGVCLLLLHASCGHFCSRSGQALLRS